MLKPRALNHAPLPSTAAKQLFPLSLATGAAASCYYILAMGVGTVVGVALGALISTTYCALACQEVICHSYDSRLLVPWLVFLALTTVGWSFALAELFFAFVFSGDATLAATVGAVLASVATAVNFKQRKMCAVAVALCCCRRRAAPTVVEVPPATPQGAPPASPPALRVRREVLHRRQLFGLRGRLPRRRQRVPPHTPARPWAATAARASAA